jgi:hypothetical protein
VTARDPFTADVCPACKPLRDGMKLARAEDHRACARLTARVKELEAEVARTHPPLPVKGCACSGCDLIRRAREDEGPVLAEGTRYEKAARCDCRCGCRVPVNRAQRICAKCEKES